MNSIWIWIWLQENWPTLLSPIGLAIIFIIQNKKLEVIKSEISHKQWSKQELKKAKLVKIEELIQCAIELIPMPNHDLKPIQNQTTEEINDIIRAEFYTPHILKIRTIQTIYFPELKEICLNIIISYATLKLLSAKSTKISLKYFDITKTGNATKNTVNEYREEINKISTDLCNTYDSFTEYIEKIIDHSHGIAEKIISEE